MMELLCELFPQCGGYAGVGLAGAWLAYRVRRRAADHERAMKRAFFARNPYFILERMR
jgi:hypothetical protein